MNEIFIELRGVRRAFSDIDPVIDSLDLRIDTGEFIALLGPSGCGKSTLLRLLAGLDRADAGEIRFGTNLKDSCGFVFQEPHLLPWRRVLENVCLPLELLGCPKKDAEEIARENINRVSLHGAIDLYPHQLSGGMKMRVSLARALSMKPKLLLLDEPFSALDENTRFRLQEDLRSLWKSLGMTVVFVTHSASEAMFLANRVLLFSQRPARVLMDHTIDLPVERSEETRVHADYLRQLVDIQSRFRSIT